MRVCALVALRGFMRILWSNVGLWERAWLTTREWVPCRACGGGRLWEVEGVKSSVWSICQRSVLDCRDRWDTREEGHWGFFKDWDYTRGLVLWPPAEWVLFTHKHPELSRCIFFTDTEYWGPALRGCLQISILIRLSSFQGKSLPSFVSRIMIGGIRAWLLNLFKLYKYLDWWRSWICLYLWSAFRWHLLWFSAI